MDEYKLNCHAMAIVNFVNETVGTSVEKRQQTNDKCFDFACEKIKEAIEEQQHEISQYQSENHRLRVILNEVQLDKCYYRNMCERLREQIKSLTAERDELVKVLKQAREVLSPYIQKFDDDTWAEICPVCKAYLDEKHINHFEWCKAKKAISEINKVIGGKEDV